MPANVLAAMYSIVAELRAAAATCSAATTASVLCSGLAEKMAKGDQGVAMLAGGAGVTGAGGLTGAAAAAFSGVPGGGLPGGRAWRGVAWCGGGELPTLRPRCHDQDGGTQGKRRAEGLRCGGNGLKAAVGSVAAEGVVKVGSGGALAAAGAAIAVHGMTAATRDGGQGGSGHRERRKEMRRRRPLVVLVGGVPLPPAVSPMTGRAVVVVANAAARAVRGCTAVLVASMVAYGGTAAAEVDATPAAPNRQQPEGE